MYGTAVSAVPQRVPLPEQSLSRDYTFACSDQRLWSEHGIRSQTAPRANDWRTVSGTQALLTGFRSDVMWALIFGAVFVGAGLVASTRSGILEAKAAGGRQIPLWRNSQGYRRPLASMLMLVAAGLLVGIGAVFFLIVWGRAPFFYRV